MLCDQLSSLEMQKGEAGRIGRSRGEGESSRPGETRPEIVLASTLLGFCLIVVGVVLHLAFSPSHPSRRRGEIRGP